MEMREGNKTSAESWKDEVAGDGGEGAHWESKSTWERTWDAGALTLTEQEGRARMRLEKLAEADPEGFKSSA